MVITAIAIIAGLILVFSLFNPLIVKLGIRNVFRRFGNTILIIIGSMVGTALITGSLVLSFSLDKTLSGVVINQVGENDVVLSVKNLGLSEELIDGINQEKYDQLAAQFNTDEYDGFVGAIELDVSPAKLENGEPAIKAYNSTLIGIELPELSDWGSEFDFPDIVLTGSTIAVSESFAKNTDAKVGDQLLLSFFGNETTFDIGSIIPENGILKHNSFWVSREYVQDLLGYENDIYNRIYLSVAGGFEPKDYDGAKVKTDVESKIDELSWDTVKVIVGERKSDALDGYGAGVFADMFLILSMFGVLAGIILLVNIFAMLADERKTELGILRAIALTRSKLTLIFGYESIIYSFFSAIVGMCFGIGVGYVIIAFLNRLISGIGGMGRMAGSFTLAFGFDHNTILTGFLVGFLITVVTSFILSAGISRLNIVEAIRKIKPREKFKFNAWVILKLTGYFLLTGSGIGLIGISQKAQAIFDRLISGEIPNFPELSETMFTKMVRLTEGMGLYFGIMMALIGFTLIVDNVLKYIFKKDFGKHVFIVAAIASILFNTFIDKFHAIGEILDYTEGVVIFFSNGLALVVSATIVIAFNFDLIAKLASFIVSKFSRLRALVNISFRYPGIHIKRTALTMIMFGIIIYLVVFIGLVRATVAEELDKATREILGEYSLSINTQPFITEADLTEIESTVISNEGIERADWVRGLSVRMIGYSGKGMSVSTSGMSMAPTDAKYREDFISAFPYQYLSSFEADFEQILDGYSEDQIWQLIDSDPSKIVLGMDYSENFAYPSPEKINVGDKFTITDSFGEFPWEVEVVGILKDNNRISGSSNFGIIVGSSFYNEVFSKDIWLKYGYNQLLVKISDDAEFDKVANGVNRTLIKLPVSSITNIADVLVSIQSVYNSIMYLFQGFLAFNLLVGSSGLAIMTVRSVQERKQQIGMLRALGFGRSDILFIFFIEISFVAISSIAVGLSMGVIGALNAFKAAYANQPDISPVFPRLEIALVVIGVYLISILLSLRPAINASKLEPVEATNYPE
ncbi:ABC transporter permease [Candidatus Dojkabacteria bacterium]|nr:ABC transporter permease [Candidatus Dojkabacteria bacterium]